MPRKREWDKATMPFRIAAKKSKFTKHDLHRLIEDVRRIRNLRNYKFFGMWKDRKDIGSSKNYVEKLRKWKRK